MDGKNARCHLYLFRSPLPGARVLAYRKQTLNIKTACTHTWFSRCGLKKRHSRPCSYGHMHMQEQVLTRVVILFASESARNGSILHRPKNESDRRRFSPM